MKFDGFVYDYLEENGKVTEAIVTDQRVAISYEQEGQHWQIAATCTDGLVYRGVLTTGGLSPECLVELAVFKAKSGAVIVFGEWLSKVTGNSHQYVFRLFPAMKSKIATSEIRKPARKRK
jgi:hypothetical protein